MRGGAGRWYRSYNGCSPGRRKQHSAAWVHGDWHVAAMHCKIALESYNPFQLISYAREKCRHYQSYSVVSAHLCFPANNPMIRPSRGGIV
jgi:hypothetical protein